MMMIMKFIRMNKMTMADMHFEPISIIWRHFGNRFVTTYILTGHQYATFAIENTCNLAIYGIKLS